MAIHICRKSINKTFNSYLGSCQRSFSLFSIQYHSNSFKIFQNNSNVITYTWLKLNENEACAFKNFDYALVLNDYECDN